jgi:hypothetical protein
MTQLKKIDDDLKAAAKNHSDDANTIVECNIRTITRNTSTKKEIESLHKKP